MPLSWIAFAILLQGRLRGRCTPAVQMRAANAQSAGCSVIRAPIKMGSTAASGTTPARRYYRLTATGVESARLALARAYRPSRAASLRPATEPT